jgi:hypothetical protein
VRDSSKRELKTSPCLSELDDDPFRLHERGCLRKGLVRADEVKHDVGLFVEFLP